MKYFTKWDLDVNEVDAVEFKADLAEVSNGDYDYELIENELYMLLIVY